MCKKNIDFALLSRFFTEITLYLQKLYVTLLERGECDIMDFKEQLEDKTAFGKSLKNFASKYDFFVPLTPHKFDNLKNNLSNSCIFKIILLTLHQKFKIQI